MLIEQWACMMPKFIELQATTERHTMEFATVRSTIAYIQHRIQWFCEHWDDEDDGDNSDEATDGDDIAAD